MKEKKRSLKRNIMKTLGQSSDQSTVEKSSTRPSLQELLKVWNQKLEDSGFQDIERRSKHYLKRETTNIALNYSEDAEQFYYNCRSFQHTETFKKLSTLEQSVWELYSEGFSYDQILNSLNKTNNLTMLCKRKPYSRTKIQRIILNLKELMSGKVH